MILILYELGFRALYVIMLYIGIAACYYLSAGFQYEYVSILWLSDYQNVDFCFDHLLTPQTNPSIESYYDISDLTQSLRFCVDDKKATDYYSTKSWAYLGYSSVCYFHDTYINPAFRVWLIRATLFYFMIAYQGYAFMLPGVCVSTRLKWIFLFHSGIVMLYISLKIIDMAHIYYAELSIEPYDSELMIGLQ